MGMVKTYSEFLNEAKVTSQFLQTKEEIKAWLVEKELYGYTINDDLKVDFSNDVYLGFCRLDSIPIQIGKVKGNFTCSGNYLTSLEGSPFSVSGYYRCESNYLTSLVFACQHPNASYENPCNVIYSKYNSTPKGLIKAHIECLLTLDSNPAETLRRLRPVYPERYFKIISASTELRELIGESEELISTYNKVKDIEGGYF